MTTSQRQEPGRGYPARAGRGKAENAFVGRANLGRFRRRLLSVLVLPSHETGNPTGTARFALAAAGDRARFADVAEGLLRVSLTGLPLNRGLEEAVGHIMGGLAELALHPDVAGSVRDLSAAGFRLVTLSNGSAQVAGRLLDDAGIREGFEALLTVEDGPAWKPVRAAYTHAATTCGVEPRQMLLVAVHPWDIHGAAGAGIRTAWINRAGGPYPDYFTPPEITIRSLRDLAPLLNTGISGRPD
jgi:2-haloacid dehalogenase